MVIRHNDMATASMTTNSDEDARRVVFLICVPGFVITPEETPKAPHPIRTPASTYSAKD